MIALIGLMVSTADPHTLLDWCEDQLHLYDALVYVDASRCLKTTRIIEEYPTQIFQLPCTANQDSTLTANALRAKAHAEILKLFGIDNWVMCCDTSEFCYHDPRRVAEMAEHAGFDSVSWYCPCFLPTATEQAVHAHRQYESPRTRVRHYYWGLDGEHTPCVQERLFRNSAAFCWNQLVSDTIRPLGIDRLAPFHPILKTYSTTNFGKSVLDERSGQSVSSDCSSQATVDDSLSNRISRYAHRSCFDGRFPVEWNIGDQFCHCGTREGDDFESDLLSAQAMITSGRLDDAEQALLTIRRRSKFRSTKSIVCCNVGVINAQRAELGSAQLAFDAAAHLDPDNRVVKNNLLVLQASLDQSLDVPRGAGGTVKPRPVLGKIAIVSFLFNWPSTGGGTIHTKELGDFLSRAGFDVLHLFARFSAWGIGRCDEQLPTATRILTFDDSCWDLESVLSRFEYELHTFCPDCVIISDSWNIKPWLATAARAFPYILRYQALENLCPLNNVRLLLTEDGQVRQCGHHQLANPEHCSKCCVVNGAYSGPLHQQEREFSRVGTVQYEHVLRESIANAAAVLVVNPLQQAIFSAWNDRTLVVPSGIDPDRFRSPRKPLCESNQYRKRILFAGLVGEFMKGYHVLTKACDLLWSKRRDFELVITGAQQGRLSGYERFVGWLSQDGLVEELLASDILVFPTVAQEALGRTAVEAMAAGIPVVASRVGGLPFTVVDHLTGLLAAPGDHVDLAEKIEILLDDARLRSSLGLQGRRRFESDYAWPKIIECDYKPLLMKICNLPK